MCGKHCKRDLCIDAIESASCSMGYPELRSLQRRAVVSFVSGKDVFVRIPTGGGKSLCYSILPQVFNLHEESSMVIVVGPFHICIQPENIFLEQPIYRAKRSVAVLKLGLLTQPCNSKCLCLPGYATSYVILLSWADTYHTVIVCHESSELL